MNDREALLRKISTHSFAAWELHLYLDTHPTDQCAMRMMSEHRAEAQALINNYENSYGPLNANSAAGGGWAWLQDPWPWDYVEGK